MNSGHIKWFNPYTNYGYIMLTDGTEVFFYGDALSDGTFVGHLGPGQGVSFDLLETRMGFEACNIQPVHSRDLPLRIYGSGPVPQPSRVRGRLRRAKIACFRSVFRLGILKNKP